MAVKLRLRREGTVKRPYYRIVAADSRSPRNGRFIEALGHYHPLDQPSTIQVDGERALHWLRNGALPTAAVEKLLRIEGVWEQFRPGDAPARVRTEKQRLSKKARARVEAEATAAAEAAAAPAPAAEEPAADEPVAEVADVEAPTEEPAADEAQA